MMSRLSGVLAPLTLIRPTVRTLHAPDGFFSLAVIAATWAISAPAIYLSLRRAGQTLTERTVPALGVMAAFIFAAQMLNFPVAGGTSGHLIGAALAAIVLGPWAAVVVMTAVVALQAIVFQDGASSSWERTCSTLPSFQCSSPGSFSRSAGGSPSRGASSLC